MADSIYELESIDDTDLDLESHFGKNGSADRLRPEDDTPAETVGEKAVESSAAENDSSYQKIISKVQVQSSKPVQSDTVAEDASTLHQATDRSSQITHLLDLVSAKGVEHAVKVAEHAEDYFVLDQLHDKMLADDFHDALVAAGVITK